jgi:hypothetical protein
VVVGWGRGQRHELGCVIGARGLYQLGRTFIILIIFGVRVYLGFGGSLLSSLWVQMMAYK